MHGPTEGHLRIGILSELAPLPVLFRCLASLRQTYPNIRLSAAFQSAKSLEAALRNGELDLVLADRPNTEPGVESTAALSLDLVAVATPAYIASRGPFDRIESVLLADLIDSRAVLPHFAHWVGINNAALAGMLQQVTPAFIVPNYEAAHTLALAGVGIAFLPRSMVETEIAEDRLVHLALGQELPSRELHLIYRSRTARPLIESLLLEHLLDHLKV